jgi:FMN phosphatase YigB (HAD superfamily)
MKQFFLRLGITPIFLLSLYGAPACPIEQFQLSQQRLTRPTVAPSRTIVAFDIDEVLLNGREKNFTEWITKHLEFAQALDSIKKKHQLHEAMEMINKVAEEYPEFAEQAREFKHLVISAPPIRGTWEIVKELAEQGYTLVSASNMTSTTYEAMVKEGSLPEEFQDDFYFVSTVPLNKKPEGGYYKKPDIEYYQNLKRYIEQKYPDRFTHIIFIDDKADNVKGAEAAQLKAIQFTSPQQLRHDLARLGVPLERSALL